MYCTSTSFIPSILLIGLHLLPILLFFSFSIFRLSSAQTSFSKRLHKWFAMTIPCYEATWSNKTNEWINVVSLRSFTESHYCRSRFFRRLPALEEALIINPYLSIITQVSRVSAVDALKAVPHKPNGHSQPIFNDSQSFIHKQTSPFIKRLYMEAVPF